MSPLAPLAHVLVGLIAASAVVWAQTAPPAPPDLATTLQRAGERVEQFFARAQTIVSTETMRLQPLDSGMMPDGFGRRVESEVRLSWASSEGSAAGLAQVERHVIRVNGRPPRPDDKDSCTPAEQFATESHPLSFLLAQARPLYSFSSARATRVDGRSAIAVDYRERMEATVEVREVEGNDDCLSWITAGGRRGRIWIDAETFDVLRLDQHLSGQIEVPLPRKMARRAGLSTSFTMERHDTTLEFKLFRFADPDETLMLPSMSTSVRITHGLGVPRQRTTVHYSNYLRMLTGGRLVGVEDGNRHE